MIYQFQKFSQNHLEFKLKINFQLQIGVRIGRPEKAAPRQMKPPTHVLFPISDKGGPTRDLLKSIKTMIIFLLIFTIDFVLNVMNHQLE